MYMKGKISAKDYGMWFMLNKKHAHLYSHQWVKQIQQQYSIASINIESAVYDTTLGKYTSNIGPMSLNCLIFQDDIAK